MKHVRHVCSRRTSCYRYGGEKEQRTLFYSVTFDASRKEEYKGIVLFQHGILEHGTRYRHVFSTFAREGFVVFAQDHLSHGRSDNFDGSKGRSGHLSVFTATNDCVSLAEECHELLPQAVQATTANRKLKVFLVGQSFGGAVSFLSALRLQKKENVNLSGLILVSSAAKRQLNLVERMKKPLLPLLVAITPTARLVDVAPPDQMARHPEEAKRYSCDPLNCPGKLSVFTSFELLRGFEEIETRKAELRIPILAIHGDMDVVCPSECVRSLVESCAGSDDKTFRILPKFWHTCFHDREWRLVADVASQWLSKRCNA